MKIFKLILILLSYLIILNSCSFKKTNLAPDDLNYVKRVLSGSDIKETKTLKGIGQARISSDKGKNSFRLAFVLKKPCKLRLVAMVGGRPFETIATNCYNIYLLSHNKSHDFYKKRLDDYTLESLIDIPVSTEDIIRFLTGGFPVKDHDYIELSVEKNGKKSILLKKNWTGLQQKIVTNEGKVEKISFFSSGKLKYTAYVKYRKTGSYLVPERFRFEEKSGNYFIFNLHRLWPNTPVKSSMFVLTPKD